MLLLLLPPLFLSLFPSISVVSVISHHHCPPGALILCATCFINTASHLILTMCCIKSLISPFFKDEDGGVQGGLGTCSVS